MDPKIWTPLGIVIVVVVFLLGGRFGSTLASKVPILDKMPQS